MSGVAKIGLTPCNVPETLYHHTNKDGMKGITKCCSMRPSTKANNPKNARYRDGQYFSDIKPGTISNTQLGRQDYRMGQELVYIYWGDMDENSLESPFEYLSSLNSNRIEQSKFCFYRNNTYSFCNQLIEIGDIVISSHDFPYDTVQEINKDNSGLWAREISYQEYTKILAYKLFNYKLKSRHLQEF